MTLPAYVNCNNEKIFVCDYYMTRDCKNTCAYVKDIGAVCNSDLLDRLEKLARDKS